MERILSIQARSKRCTCTKYTQRQGIHWTAGTARWGHQNYTQSKISRWGSAQWEGAIKVFNYLREDG